MMHTIKADPSKLRELVENLKELEVSDGQDGFSDQEIQEAKNILARDLSSTFKNMLSEENAERLKEALKDVDFSKKISKFVLSSELKDKIDSAHEKGEVDESKNQKFFEPTLLSAMEFLDSTSLKQLLVGLENVIANPEIMADSCEVVSEESDPVNTTTVSECSGEIELQIDVSENGVHVNAVRLTETVTNTEPRYQIVPLAADQKQ